MENKDPAVGKCELPSPFSLWGTWEEVSVELRATKAKEMQKCSRKEKQGAWWRRVVCKREMTIEKLNSGKKEICMALLPDIRVLNEKQ